MSAQRWQARLSLLLAAGAIVVPVVFAGLKSIALIGLPAGADRARAVPLLSDSEVRLVALLALPKMNVPPVAA